MNVTQALREALTSAKDDLASVMKQLTELTHKQARIREEIKGLEYALSRREGTGAVFPSGWEDLPRTDAVIRVLELAGNPLSPKEITERLKSTGRDDEYRLVSAALSYLKRIEVVESAGYGLWRLSPDHASDGMQPMFDEGLEE